MCSAQSGKTVFFRINFEFTERGGPDSAVENIVIIELWLLCDMTHAPTLSVEF